MKKKIINKTGFSKKEAENILKGNNKEVPKQIIMDKFGLLMRMNIGDLLAFFDLVNAICSGASHFVTNNELIILTREKLVERVKNFKIITPEEVGKILDEKNIVYKEQDKGCIG